jgi:hypothetical protein
MSSTASSFAKKLYRGIEDLQADLDAWLKECNEIRTHRGRWCFGKTPMQTYIDTLPLAKEKSLQPAQPPTPSTDRTRPPADRRMSDQVPTSTPYICKHDCCEAALGAFFGHSV